MKALSLGWLLLLIVNTTFSQSKSKDQQQTQQNMPSKPPVGKDAKDEKVIAPQGKEVVAIYHFTTSHDFSYDYAVGIGNAVEAGFVRSSRFVVVERSRFGELKAEEKFKEANTRDVIQKATKFGAKIIVTGHLVGVSKGVLVDSYAKPTGEKFCDISLSFKIIDVESGEIKLSETISGRGTGNTEALALQNSYVAIDNVVRKFIAYYLPQKFKFMNIVSTTTKKKTEYLDYFKIWGGAEDGLKIGDAVDVFQISYVINPATNQRIEEKKLIAYATIVEVNSGSTATCQINNIKNVSKYNVEILNIAKSNPESIVVENKGTTITKPKSFWDSF